MHKDPILDERTLVGMVARPLDTLFFRGGHPFAAADRGKGAQLPSPQVLFGMIRTFLMRHPKIGDTLPVHQPDAPYKRVGVAGPWLAQVDDSATPPRLKKVFVPAPAHLVWINAKDPEKKRLALLAPMAESPCAGMLAGAFPEDSPPRKTDPALCPLIVTETPDSAEGAPEPVQGFLDLDGLKIILDGKIPDCRHLVKHEDLFVSESRTGVSIDPATQTAKDRQLYSAEHLRLRDDIVLYFELGWERGAKEAEKPDEARKMLQDTFGGNPIVLPMGGESRRVHLQHLGQLAQWPAPAGQNPPPEQGGFATMLITPVIFAAGERSENKRQQAAADDAAHAGQSAAAHPANGRAPWQSPDMGRLVAAAVSKPQPVSGWELQSRCPKPTRYSVPAGAVYFWKTGKNAPPDRPTLDRMQLAEIPLDRMAGWGIALRARWTYPAEG
jgi:CRISPR-associated protein Cmr3